MKIAFFLVATIFVIHSKAFCQKFPFSELTKKEFIQFETNQGAKFLPPQPHMGYILDNTVYPYASLYHFSQPILGERPMTIDSVTNHFVAYYAKKSKKVKYVSYVLSPKTKSFLRIVNEMIAKGVRSSKKIMKILNEQVNNTNYQNRLTQTYQEIKKLLSSKGNPISNRKYYNVIPPGAKNIITYKINQAKAELMFQRNPGGANIAVELDIYWK